MDVSILNRFFFRAVPCLIDRCWCSRDFAFNKKKKTVDDLKIWREICDALHHPFVNQRSSLWHWDWLSFSSWHVILLFAVDKCTSKISLKWKTKLKLRWKSRKVRQSWANLIARYVVAVSRHLAAAVNRRNVPEVHWAIGNRQEKAADESGRNAAATTRDAVPNPAREHPVIIIACATTEHARIHINLASSESSVSATVPMKPLWWMSSHNSAPSSTFKSSTIVRQKNRADSASSTSRKSRLQQRPAQPAMECRWMENAFVSITQSPNAHTHQHPVRQKTFTLSLLVF